LIENRRMVKYYCEYDADAGTGWSHWKNKIGDYKGSKSVRNEQRCAFLGENMELLIFPAMCITLKIDSLSNFQTK
jgi:hypothetical protein